MWENVVADAVKDAVGKFTDYKIVIRCYYTAVKCHQMSIHEVNSSWKCETEQGTISHLV